MRRREDAALIRNKPTLGLETVLVGREKVSFLNTLTSV